VGGRVMNRGRERRRGRVRRVAMIGHRLGGVGKGGGRLVCGTLLVGRGVGDTRLGWGRSVIVLVHAELSTAGVGAGRSEDRAGKG
jgi:hypothetical protein